MRSSLKSFVVLAAALALPGLCAAQRLCAAQAASAVQQTASVDPALAAAAGQAEPMQAPTPATSPVNPTEALPTDLKTQAAPAVVGSHIKPVSIGAWHSYEVEAVDGEGTVKITVQSNARYLKRSEYSAEVDRVRLPDGRIVTRNSTFLIIDGWEGKQTLEQVKTGRLFEDGTVELTSYAPCDCPAGWLGKMFGRNDWAGYSESHFVTVVGIGEKAATVGGDYHVELLDK